MVNVLSRSASGMPAPAGPRRSPSQDAQLSTARAKLQDWVTCPSAKTPEGKAEVRKATDKLESIKSEIKKSDDASSQASAADSKNTASGARPAADAAPDGGDDVLAALARRNPSAASIFGAAALLGGRLDLQA